MRKRLSLSLGVVLLAVVPGGCVWPLPGQGPDRQAHNATEDAIGVDTVASLDQVWAASLDGRPAGDPVTSVHGVHVSSERSVYGFRSDSGQRRWAYTPTPPVSARQPLGAADDVLVPRWDRTAPAENDDVDVTVALDAETGADGGSVVEGQAVASRGRLVLSWDVRFFGTRVSRFWAAELVVRDLDTGTRLCCPLLYSTRGDTSPPPPDPVPLTLGSEWIVASGQGFNDPDDLPAQGNGVRGISIRDPKTCDLYHCPDWAVPLDGSTSTAPVLSDDERVVFVGTDAGTVYAVDPSTSTVRWSRAVGSAVTDSPALAAGSLFVPTASGNLVVLDAATGALRWAGSTGSRIGQQPAVAGGVVFTGSANGVVSAFDAAGCGGVPLCARLWTRSTGSAITGAPAVSAGQLYVGTADGRLVAFGL